MIQILPPERFEQVQAALREELAAQRASAPEPVNEAHARSLYAGHEVPFRDTAYHVPPLSWEDGMRMGDLSVRIDEAVKQAREHGCRRPYRKAMKAMLRFMWSRTAPPGWRRLVRRFQPNPFMRAGPEEIKELARGFERRLTSSPRDGR